MVWVPSDLREIQEQVQQGQAPTLTVRRLLSWFSSERRGSRVVSSIHAALRELALTTRPNFEDAWIDGEITFSSTTPEPRRPSVVPPGPDPEALAGTVGVDAPEAPGLVVPEVPPVELPVEPGVVAVVPPAVPSLPVAELVAQPPNTRPDPVFRLGKLAAANRAPTTVNPETPLSQAVTKMMLDDFSQLPVITSLYRVEGAVSWKSIAQAYALRATPVLVKDCLGYAPVYSADDSVFEAIDDIMQYGFTLVSARKKLQGIVTLVDVASEFRGSFEPFVLIGEIERHLRQLIDRQLPLAMLRSLCSASEQHPIDSAADLSFGQYQRLLQREDVWQLCGLRVDRVETVKRVDQLREIRNEMMHFQSEAISEQNLQDIRDFAMFLREILR